MPRFGSYAGLEQRHRRPRVMICIFNRKYCFIWRTRPGAFGSRAGQVQQTATEEAADNDVMVLTKSGLRMLPPLNVYAGFPFSVYGSLTHFSA